MIRVQNVYYMLAYAFRILHEREYKDVATEDFENVTELLSAILCRGVSVQIKQGLCREYLANQEPLDSPRGKIEIGASIKSQTIRKKQLVCTYDEFSVDAKANRILKTTMELLLLANISKERKKELRKLLLFFKDVTSLDKRCIDWNVQYDRNNQTYRMLLAICKLVIKGLLQTDSAGNIRIKKYIDDQSAATLYEKFILAYFRREHSDLKAYSPQIAWQVDDGFGDRLPTMQSDIVISNPKTKKTLIIDAKHYAHNMQSKADFSARTIYSAHLYQIFAYVKNWKAEPGETVSGMLLYAGTDDEIQPNHQYLITGNQISVRTLDLNCDFSMIAATLDGIAASIK